MDEYRRIIIHNSDNYILFYDKLASNIFTFLTTNKFPPTVDICYLVQESDNWPLRKRGFVKHDLSFFRGRKPSKAIF